MSPLRVELEVSRADPPALGHCRGCEQAIEWVTTRHGKRMPVNHPLEPIRIYHRLDRSIITVIASDTSHFVTCPKAADFRKRDNRATAQPTDRRGGNV